MLCLYRRHSWAQLKTAVSTAFGMTVKSPRKGVSKMVTLFYFFSMKPKEFQSSLLLAEMRSVYIDGSFLMLEGKAGARDYIWPASHRQAGRSPSQAGAA